MTRGDQVYTTKLVVSLDRRAKFTAADRKVQFDTVMGMYGLMRDMSFDVDRINSVRIVLADRAAKVPADDPLHSRLISLADRADEIRRKIVATKEGGAVTGEERIREKASNVYGAVNGFEGRPGEYQVSRIASLKHELDDVVKEFDAFISKELAEVNASLTQKKLETIQPMNRADWEKANSDSGSGGL
jgi:hypothetical protein